MSIIRCGVLAVVTVLAALGGAQRAAATDTRPQAAATAAVPPVARTVNVVDHEFGLTLPDPYRWMEGSNNAEFDAWLKAQGAYTRTQLDALPTLAAWRERLQKASGATVVYVGFMRAGGKLFFLRITGKGSPTLMLRDATGNERTLLDPASLSGGKGQTIRSFAPSPDGRLVAIDIGLGAGMEVTRIKILDTQTLHWLPDTIEPVWGEFTARWLPDGRGFTYTQMAPTDERRKGDPLQSMRARLHVLGSPAAQDPILLRAGEGPGANANFKLASDEFPVIEFSPASRWAVAIGSGARPEQRVCVALRTVAMRPDADWHCIAEYADGVHDFALHGDTLYLVSVHGNPNGRVLALDLAKPDVGLQDARVVLPTADDAVVVDLAAARDALYVKRMRNGIDELLRVDYATGKATPITLPFAGTVGYSANPEEDGVILGVQGWTTFGSTYLWRPADGTLHDLGIRDIVPGDYSMLTSLETEATSKDGTRVPLSIIYRKDIRLDGRHRALVRAYGGYGISLRPGFDPFGLEWVKEGGVVAVCHVRGGGEKGDAWHRAGQGANKHKGVEDFIACAEELARRGYSTPARTALESASMGGLLVGGAITAYPERFGAALVNSAELNPVRLLVEEDGANQIGELGDPRTAAGLKAIAAMDPYQHIRPGTKYPAVLLNVGLRDSRVSPWITGKFAAKLQADSTSGRPVWIRTNAEAGHFAFSLNAAAMLRADQYAFLDAELPGP